MYSTTDKKKSITTEDLATKLELPIENLVQLSIEDLATLKKHYEAREAAALELDVFIILKNLRKK
jgi:hypothetical protein